MKTDLDKSKDVWVFFLKAHKLDCDIDACVDLIVEESRKAGIKEVVRYVETRKDKNSYDEYWGYFVIDPEDWQTKLKKWGLI